MVAKHARGGVEALIDMPADYWAEIGAIGTFDDALAHVSALEAVGVDSVNIFPADEIEIAWEVMPGIAELAAR
jgi:5,10-methylenetetrahydromethanopterin reductase